MKPRISTVLYLAGVAAIILIHSSSLFATVFSTDSVQTEKKPTSSSVSHEAAVTTSAPSDALPSSKSADKNSDSSSNSSADSADSVEFYKPTLGATSTANPASTLSENETAEAQTATSSLSSSSSFGNFSGFSGPTAIGKGMKLGQTTAQSSSSNSSSTN